MGKTPIYKLGYFEPNQDIGSELDLDELRFKAIDTQTQALYSIFGNGVLDDDPANPSWYILSIPNDYNNVLITSGRGHVSWKYSETTTNTTFSLPALPAGATSALFYLYAVENDTTPSAKTVDFVASLIQIVDLDNYIGLGAVLVDRSTDPDTITIYNTAEYGRVDISLFGTIAGIVNKHKHIGGSTNPSPIDLSKHVRGKLSGDYIENLDLDKVTSGSLSADRLPVIDHNDLSNIGSLTHTQIDTLLASLTSLNDNYRLSDISLANRLKIVLALKRLGTLNAIESTQINAIFYVPNSTSQPYEATGVPGSLNLATIDRVNKRLEGTNASTISSDNVIWNTYEDFDRAWKAAQNRVIANSPISQNISLTAPRLYTTGSVSNINTVTITGSSTLWSSLILPARIGFGTTNPSSVTTWFTISSITNNTTLVLTSSAAGQSLGNYVIEQTSGVNGSVTIDKTLKYLGILDTNLQDAKWKDGYLFTDKKTKTSVVPPPPPVLSAPGYYYNQFSTTQDWTERSRIGIGFGFNTASIPGNVYVYLVLSSGGTVKNIMSGSAATSINISTPVQILSKDFTDPKTRLYVEKNFTEFGLTDAQLASVAGIGFVWDTAEYWDGKELNFYLLHPRTDEIIANSSQSSSINSAMNTLPDTESSVFIFNDTLFNTFATLVFRLDTNSTTTTFDQVLWDSTVPTGTSIRVYSRTSDTESLLGNYLTNEITEGTWTVNPNSSRGRYFDIIVNLYANSSKTLAPTLDRLVLAYNGLGATATKVWNKYETDLATGQTGWFSTAKDYNNITFGPNTTDTDFPGKTVNYLSIFNTGKIGKWRYIRKNNALESSMLDASDEIVVEDGIDTSSLSAYQSPVQVWRGYNEYGFLDPKYYEEFDTSSLFADTKNDRVVEFNNSGAITKIFQGNLRLKRETRDFVLLNSYYNPNVGKLYINFSQYVTISAAGNLTLVSGKQSVKLSETGVNAILFDPIGGLSATVVVTFSTTLKNTINSWGSSIKLIVQNGAFSFAGNDGGSLEETTTTTDVCQALDYIEYATNSLLLGEGKCLTGITQFTNTINDSGDFNKDGSIVTSSLYGPDKTLLTSSNTLTIDVLVGNIFMTNILEPIHVTTNKYGYYIVSNISDNSIIALNSSGESVWTVPSTVCSFIENKLGSAIELSNENLLIAIPSPVSDNAGRLIVLNRISDNTILTSININGDAVKAIEETGSEAYWVLVDDVANSGKQSRLIKINSSGELTYSWGVGTLIHPTGLKMLENSTLVVSE
jgi:hypothetical protein